MEDSNLIGLKKTPWIHSKQYINSNESIYWIKLINNNISWEQPKVRVYGKAHFVPRLTYFLADRNISYSYSGLVHHGSGWPFWFVPLLKKVESFSSINFNGCLLNMYRSGKDKMGWHSDDEKELDSSKPIASLSLGAERDFILKHKNYSVKYKLKLSDGDLLLMQPECQENWLHSLPSRKNINNTRINLTFRVYRV
tara:strand:+ start:451 stop:1038 length:588 start_codon:yes stop_codon:yes gene_type:complete